MPGAIQHFQLALNLATTQSNPELAESIRTQTDRFVASKGSEPVSHFHKRLGKIMWEHCGMARTRASLTEALKQIPALREEFWANVKVPGSAATLNQSLEQAGRVADFLELGELLCLDALTREESCGGHFREEHQTPEGEAKRDDEHFAHASVWEHQGESAPAVMHKEPLTFENVHLATRSYK